MPGATSPCLCTAQDVGGQARSSTWTRGSWLRRACSSVLPPRHSPRSGDVWTGRCARCSPAAGRDRPPGSTARRGRSGAAAPTRCWPPCAAPLSCWRARARRTCPATTCRRRRCSRGQSARAAVVVTRFPVDLDEVAAVVGDLDAFERQLTAGLGEVDRLVATLQSAWTDAAADAQAQAPRQWASGAAEMRRGRDPFTQVVQLPLGVGQGAAELVTRDPFPGCAAGRAGAADPADGIPHAGGHSAPIQRRDTARGGVAVHGKLDHDVPPRTQNPPAGRPADRSRSTRSRLPRSARGLLRAHPAHSTSR